MIVSAGLSESCFMRRVDLTSAPTRAPYSESHLAF